jgi:hypothetical protein
VHPGIIERVSKPPDVVLREQHHQPIKG